MQSGYCSKSCRLPGKSKNNGSGWIIGIEKPNLKLSQKCKISHRDSANEFLLKQGDIATSDDVYRYLIKDGVAIATFLTRLQVGQLKTLRTQSQSLLKAVLKRVFSPP